MFTKNVIKMTALCLSFFAMLSATVVAQKQDNSLQPQVLGTTVPGIDIIVRKKPGNIIAAKATTDEDGKFSFTLPPGEYTITVKGKKVEGNGSTVSVQSNNTDNTSRKKSPPRHRWISASGSPYKLSLDGDGLTIGADSKGIRDGMEVSFAIKNKGVTREGIEAKDAADKRSAVKENDSEAGYHTEDRFLIRVGEVKISGIVEVVVDL